MRGQAAKTIRRAAYFSAQPSQRMSGYAEKNGTRLCTGVRRAYKLMKKAYKRNQRGY